MEVKKGCGKKEAIEWGLMEQENSGEEAEMVGMRDYRLFIRKSSDQGDNKPLIRPSLKL